MHVKFPHEEFNKTVKNGTVGEKMQKIIESSKPQSVFFTEANGRRSALMIVNMENESQIPKLAEPWFLQFNADVEFHVVMSPEDLDKAGLDDLGKMWH